MTLTNKSCSVKHTNFETYLPFNGLKVIELASVLAGPLAGTFFAEGGAEVTKVEHPVYGDITRSWRSKEESLEGNISSYFAAANTFKKVIKVDLASVEGRKWIESELEDCDVLLQNFKSSDLAKFNLTPKYIAEKFPDVVHIRLVGFAKEPDRLAYDVVVQAETGFMHMNGSHDRPPSRLPVALMDVLASHQIRSAATTGLFSREKGATGIYAEVSLELSAIAALANQATNFLMNGTIPTRQGSLHPNIAPYGETLMLNDGEIVLAVGSDKQFKALCQVLGNEQLSIDDRFKSNILRVKNRKILLEELQNLVASKKRDQLLKEFHKSKVPAGAIRTLEEVFNENTSGHSALIEEKITGEDRMIIKPRTTAYSVMVFGK
ncbi:MAG: carnitine dehydratase [Bacteroidetes bacterium]|nr:MAG: carnitine dehydratase [Bacteroidota bacterium]